MTADDTEKSGTGCGLLAAVLVMGAVACVFLAGIAGLTSIHLTLFQGGEALTPTKLAYGGLVDARVLAPMRAAGLLRHDEVPDVFHAERADGTAACAISQSRVLRLDGDGAQVLVSADITRLNQRPDGVELSDGTTTFTCRFGEGEGGDRFARMLGGARPRP